VVAVAVNVRSTLFPEQIIGEFNVQVCPKTTLPINILTTKTNGISALALNVLEKINCLNQLSKKEPDGSIIGASVLLISLCFLTKPKGVKKFFINWLTKIVNHIATKLAVLFPLNFPLKVFKKFVEWVVLDSIVY